MQRLKISKRLYTNTTIPTKQQLKEIFPDILKNRIGTITSFFMGSILGAFVFSKSFTIKKGEMSFSTNGNHHALALLEDHYKTRVKHLKEKAKTYHDQYENLSTTPEAKQEVLKNVISHYLVPTSHDHLFGKDVVLFNGKGKPTILVREDFDEINDNFKRVLSISKTFACVEDFKIGNDFSAWDEQTFLSACKKCLK